MLFSAPQPAISDTPSEGPQQEGGDSSIRHVMLEQSVDIFYMQVCIKVLFAGGRAAHLIASGGASVAMVAGGSSPGMGLSEEGRSKSLSFVIES